MIDPTHAFRKLEGPSAALALVADEYARPDDSRTFAFDGHDRAISVGYLVAELAVADPDLGINGDYSCTVLFRP